MSELAQWCLWLLSGNIDTLIPAYEAKWEQPDTLFPLHGKAF